MDFLASVLGPFWEQRDAIIGLCVAAVLGGVVGLERESSGKPAGFRTHLLICVGAALLTELSIAIAEAAAAPGGVRADPGRIAAQIVSGVGFLGAGTIIQARGNVVGLTTAASLWVVAAIGMAVGAHEYVMALSATALVFITLRILGRVEERLKPSLPADHTLQVEVRGEMESIHDVERIIRDGGNEVRLVEVKREDDGYVASYHTHGNEASRNAAVRSLLMRQGVRRIAVL